MTAPGGRRGTRTGPWPTGPGHRRRDRGRRPRGAVDDFGTGHSSLGYLENFPVHEVKVDLILVESLAHDPVDSAIVRAVVDLEELLQPRPVPALERPVARPGRRAGLRVV